ncbi:tyrosine-type recombinase/integrase [Campylobacter fetus subsp. venerealis]|uniref:tyrosine-type recombinase/integrase n=1 Tax=Campylobacter fetus TaxID=196 RepID=UPI0018E7A4BD|nr:site-specific integrase [Campylobacter fetus]QQF52111.1 tyrosine-type recombinase/integrase [Campylobacter fetus subsp. venerealis]
MGNIAKITLQDRDIKNLALKPKQYRKVVGNPKELYIQVNPKGTKTFTLKFDNKFIRIGEWRESIFTTTMARTKSTQMLRELNSGKHNIYELRGKKNDTYIYENLFYKIIEHKQKSGKKESYLSKVVGRHKQYFLPAFGKMDIKDIKYSDIKEVLSFIFNPHDPKKSRLETIHRLIDNINEVFTMAQRDEHIEKNLIASLHSEFPTSRTYKHKLGIDSRLAAITNDNTLAEFLYDLKCDGKMDLQTKRAIYLQILCVNRPINTTSVRWEYINFDENSWIIPANEMKMGYAHKIALSSYAVKILNEQRKFCVLDNGFIFPAFNKQNHLHKDSLNKAIINLNGGKYKGIATAHGFRATFRTICSKNKAELLKMGISDEAIETALAHKKNDAIKYAYERSKTTDEQLIKLMQWYGDYLNGLEQLF